MGNIYLDEKRLRKASPIRFSKDTYHIGGTFYKKGDRLYKLFNYNYYLDEVERNIDYLLDHSIPHTPSLYDKLYIRKDFSGYTMDYLKNTITFRKSTLKSIPFELKMKAIMDICEVFHYLHSQNICVGDVHSDNFLIDKKGNGYVIDLDYLVFPTDIMGFQQLYWIVQKRGSSYMGKVSPYTDQIKLIISCFSLLMEIDLERAFMRNGDICLENIFPFIEKYYSCHELKDYLNDLIKGESSYYFDSFLKENKGIYKKLKK